MPHRFGEIMDADFVKMKQKLRYLKKKITSLRETVKTKDK
jgi:hypothetical protein